MLKHLIWVPTIVSFCFTCICVCVGESKSKMLVWGSSGWVLVNETFWGEIWFVCILVGGCLNDLKCPFEAYFHGWNFCSGLSFGLSCSKNVLKCKGNDGQLWRKFGMHVHIKLILFKDKGDHNELKKRYWSVWKYYDGGLRPDDNQDCRWGISCRIFRYNARWGWGDGIAVYRWHHCFSEVDID